VIELHDLRKSYGDVEALKGISTSIQRGEVVGLLGPNGAGKTTAMKILVGYLVPTSGRARVAGFDVVDEPIEVQRRIGYLPENAPVYGEMLVQEYLWFIAEMRGLDRGTARRRILHAAEQCRIESVLARPIGQLSKGFRQRVGLAAAILHEPELLILDEPTVGLDPNQIVEVRDLVRRMGRTKTVLLSTHILPEVEATCDRAVILIDGLIRADQRLTELTESRALSVSLAPPDPGQARAALGATLGVRAVEHVAADGRFHTFRLEIEPGTPVAEAIAELAAQRGWPLRELRRDDRTLEQVFRELTGAKAGAAA
jgi:ABC-2 type transport system ATP-binding protein